MGKKSSWNPLAFTSPVVTLITSAVYIALFAVLLWTHIVVPPAPDNPSPDKGLNLTQAWLDLEFISAQEHPINSHRNEVVKSYLETRIGVVLNESGVAWDISGEEANEYVTDTTKKDAAVTLFARDTSNVTFVDNWRGLPYTCYGESENILVYIRGKDDEPGAWWATGKKYNGQAGVLVNAHYDSVPSGYGATDDGVGVVSILQLISYFTADGNQPKRGIVMLLNNGEENGLYGSKNYLGHPVSQFPHTFLNLEGAGAGGRAMLFRSTDAVVTKFYSHKTPYPFGSVISGDGFKRGAIRSGTDYSVFVDDLGLRGLDLAFYEPRARYHTDQDTTRETSPASLWHMLSAALATVKGFAEYKGDEFDGAQDRDGRLKTGKGTDGVWFDVLGRSFVVLKLPTLFALSVTLLVAAPILLIVLQIILTKKGKWYPMSIKAYLFNADDEEAVQLGGFRGFFRAPIAFAVATAAVAGLALLVTKLNPFIVYSSQYTVWAMMLTVWFAIAWFFLAGADRVRPTALQRMFVLMWTYAISWVLLVAATAGMNNLQLGSGYFFVLYNFAIFLALLISYLELLNLPTKAKYVEHVVSAEQDAASIRPGSQSSRSLLGRNRERPHSARGPQDEDEDATESTSLLRESDARSHHTFTGVNKRHRPETDGTLDETDDPFLTKAYGDEQAWSSSLPQWTWVLQLLVLAPVNIIIVGQIALLATSALHQTPADGNAPLPIYFIIAGLTVLLLLPLTPFIHRFTYHIPTILFLVFVGCLVYSLIALPFTRSARMKHYFVQTIDLDTGVNNVTIKGLEGYIQDIIAELPSAAGQSLDCGTSTGDARRNGLQACTWHGLAPHVAPITELSMESHKKKKSHGNDTSPSSPYTAWLDYNISVPSNQSSSASLTFRGSNSKACYITFSTPITALSIADAAIDPRFQTVADGGSERITLFSRTWDKTFNITVGWEGQLAKGQTGRMTCLWSEVNAAGVVPAWDEVKRFEPVWAAATKASDGLVEGWRDFVI